MFRNTAIVLTLVVVVALPFIFRQQEDPGAWKPGDPELVVITPHNEAIRYEFGLAFSEWHQKQYGQPVKVDWRVIGGTTEIMRYLAAEYVMAFRAWWLNEGNRWPDGGGAMILDRRFKPGAPPDDLRDSAGELERWHIKCRMHRAMRETDDPAAFTCRIDVFFGGGTYDHGKAGKQGLTVSPWPSGGEPAGLLRTEEGEDIIPERMSGETWRNRTFLGTAVSTFGICYNKDRLRDLGVASPPERWEDLSDPAYFRQIGVADPTKSGSIAKAFEMIIHEQCHLAVTGAGFTGDLVSEFESAIRNADSATDEFPDSIPAAYQEAVEAGWLNGLRLVQRIGANARYFTDSAGKVPIDVGAGDAAAGLAIDFFGRFQSETSRNADGEERMVYVTPAGGSSVSADPISLLRGAEHRETAVRFVRFVLSEEGQKLWNYAPGTPGGPRKFALRRLPIRRDFYPPADALSSSSYEEHEAYAVDRLGDPSINPYELARRFTYHSRWTGRHFSLHRDLIRVMCLDAGEELRAAWQAILDNGGPGKQPEAVAMLGRMPDRPEPLTWQSARSIGSRHDRIDYMREWTLFFRESYGEAKRNAERAARNTDDG